jgi:hypothetical protein
MAPAPNGFASLELTGVWLGDDPPADEQKKTDSGTFRLLHGWEYLTTAQNARGFTSVNP